MTDDNKAYVEAYAANIKETIEKLLFDDSFANQVCSCRKCNKEKGDVRDVGSFVDQLSRQSQRQLPKAGRLTVKSRSFYCQR